MPFRDMARMKAICFVSCATTAQLPTGKQRLMRSFRPTPSRSTPRNCPQGDLVEHARAAWDLAVGMGEKYGYRNAQATVVAPTGTIGLVMDCDTTGIEPDFALVKFKKLAGGGYFKIINRAVPQALRTLGYKPDQIEEIVGYAVGHGTLANAPAINHETLAAKGFTQDALEIVEGALATAFDIRFAFNKYSLGEAFCTETLGLDADAMDDIDFDMLSALGFSNDEIDAAKPPCLRCDDVGRCAWPRRCAPSRLRLREPVRTYGQTLPLCRKPHSHDGGRHNPLSRALSRRPSTCPTRPRWRTAKKATCCPGNWGSKPNALYRDGSKTLPAAQCTAGGR